ncbi:hypothetical protein [Phenylobacterium sp.]|jgi:hypothetical protein|uniref:hypothetical protein n=1 Tax=Phenylobacterium sp. TaxID=1871053 RepID=UPI002F94E9D5
MTVRVDGEVIWLQGACRVEEAETLAAALERRLCPVDLSDCTSLHAAVAQVLLAFAPPLRGAPQLEFLRDHLAPALAAATRSDLRQTSARPGVMDDGRPRPGHKGEGALD